MRFLGLWHCLYHTFISGSLLLSYHSSLSQLSVKQLVPGCLEISFICHFEHGTSFLLISNYFQGLLLYFLNFHILIIWTNGVELNLSCSLVHGTLASQVHASFPLYLLFFSFTLHSDPYFLPTEIHSNCILNVFVCLCMLKYM